MEAELEESKAYGVRMHSGQRRHIAKKLNIREAEVNGASLKLYIMSLDSDFPADKQRGKYQRKKK